MNLDFIARPLGKLLYFIYNSFHFLDGSNNYVGIAIAYGLSIIIFTLVIKTCLLPLTLKQYKSTAKMQKVQPQIKEVQERHKNDKEKLNAELMKVYKENDVNPAGGCLPLLIQMPIIFTLYWVIVQPMKFMLSKSTEQIAGLITFANKIITDLNLTNIPKFKANSLGVEIDLINFFNKHVDQLANTKLLKPNELINMNFLGMQLGEKATYVPATIMADPGKYVPLLLLVIFGVVVTFISAKLSIPPKQLDAKKDATSSMTNSMLYLTPIMTLIFSFTLPAGVILYWIVGYVFQTFQQLYVNKHIYKRTGAK